MIKPQTNHRACRILHQYRIGMLTEPEALRMLDRQQVRGGFNENRDFNGYDYGLQQWVQSTGGIIVEE